jgi:hypothetical protein
MQSPFGLSAADRDEDADAGTDVALVCEVVGSPPARLIERGSAWRPAGDGQAQQVLIGGPPPYSALASSSAPSMCAASGSLWEITPLASALGVLSGEVVDG